MAAWQRAVLAWLTGRLEWALCTAWLLLTLHRPWHGVLFIRRARADENTAEGEFVASYVDAMMDDKKEDGFATLSAVYLALKSYKEENPHITHCAVKTDGAGVHAPPQPQPHPLPPHPHPRTRPSDLPQSPSISPCNHHATWCNFHSNPNTNPHPNGQVRTRAWSSPSASR